MNEMITWLRAQLDTDERLALAVKPLRRVPVIGGPKHERFTHSRVSFRGDDGAQFTSGDREADAHFARHDPDRVLRQVQAHRAILDRYADALARGDDPEYSMPEAWTQAREYEDFVIPALVSIYSDRDGYKEEWSRG